MRKTLLESAIAYVATNIDDIFILIFLYASAATRSDFRKIMLGKYIGCYAILAVSFLAAFGLGLISEDCLRFLGIVPILLGIKAYFEEKSQEDSAHPMREVKSSFVATAAMITIANSADNIGVYIPLFAEYSLPQMLITVIVFTVMTFLWCILGEKIATLAPIQNTIQKYKRIAIPLIYILLGIYILIF